MGYIISTGTDYGHLHQIQSGALVNLTKSKLVGDISVNPLSLVIVHMKSLAVSILTHCMC